MKISRLISVLAIPVFFSAAAVAADAGDAGASTAAPGVARAEVLADLAIWRESGLAVLESGEGALADTPRYDEAMAVYQRMRESPAFVALVRRIADQRGEKLLVAGAN